MASSLALIFQFDFYTLVDHVSQWAWLWIIPGQLFFVTAVLFLRCENVKHQQQSLTSGQNVGNFIELDDNRCDQSDGQARNDFHQKTKTFIRNSHTDSYWHLNG